MQVPLYTLGVLIRFGPQHGYQIKKIFREQISDFTQIKLPTIYYYLKKMRKAGLVSAEQARDALRPEKTVYSITAKGRKEFHRLLDQYGQFDYRPTFPSDAVFYFLDESHGSTVVENVMNHIRDIQSALSTIEEHKKVGLGLLPREAKAMASIIFDRHASHFRAELEWAERTLSALERRRILTQRYGFH